MKRLPWIAAAALFATAAGAAAPPALYTAQQAKDGSAVFAQNCAMCHGKNLQGISGPTLMGQNFASASNNYTVSAIFNEVSQQMPAGNPGSLSQTQYAAVMAFLLQKNGYPAGSKPLSYAEAQTSTVPLVSQVK